MAVRRSRKQSNQDAWDGDITFVFILAHEQAIRTKKVIEAFSTCMMQTLWIMKEVPKSDLSESKTAYLRFFVMNSWWNDAIVMAKNNAHIMWKYNALLFVECCLLIDATTSRSIQGAEHKTGAKYLITGCNSISTCYAKLNFGLRF